jgi:hypothetical protein
LRTLAFFFESDSAAASARPELDGSDGVPARDIETAPLVVEGQEGTILALSVEVDARDVVMDAAVQHGGRLVADIPEDWL